MGKVLGGGSSINVMCWARGHQSDWDHFAAEAGDDAWGYEAVLDIYRRIEDWRGQPDPTRRGCAARHSSNRRRIHISSAPRSSEVLRASGSRALTATTVR